MHRSATLRRLAGRLAMAGVIVVGGTVGTATPASAIAIDGYQYTGPGGGTCYGGYRPGLARLISWMSENSAWTPTHYSTYCDPTSLHHEGRAVDWFLNVRDAAQRARAEDLVYTLMAPDVEGNAHSLARRMGVQEIIWNDLVWDARYGDAGWIPYHEGGPGQTCFNIDAASQLYTDMHCDHVHIGVHWGGANEQTTFWNSLYTQRSDSTFFVSGEGTLTSAGATVGRPIFGRPRDDRLGLPGDKPIAGDWDGNRSTTIGVVRGSLWYLRNGVSTGRGDIVFGYGWASDTPVVGDWNGDRRQTPGVVRVENGQLRWYLRNSNSTGAADLAFSYGMPGDTPVVGDWNGDGVQTIGVVRSNGSYLVWYLRNSNTTGVADVTFGYGLPGDRVVAGDWNGDGRDTQGIARAAAASSFCPGGGMQWKLSDTLAAGANRTFSYGCWGDRPLAGDWNASGTDTVAVARRF